MSANTVIAMPANDTDFEEKCVPLFAGHVGDPNFKRVATRGKNQKGIDLIGARDRDPQKPVAVQCKLKTKGDKLGEAAVRSDVARALAIRPPLTELYVATTASDDLAYDILALTLRQEQAALGRMIDIQIWGWDELQRRIRGDRVALNAFDPDHSASTAQLIAITTETRDTGDANRATISGLADQSAQILQAVGSLAATFAGSDSASRLAVDAVLNAQIDQIRDLLNSGKPRTALTMLETLEQTLTPQHSAAVRARVKANRGFACLKLDDTRAAGELLLQAWTLDPGDRKIRANRVLGLALAGEPDRALAEARSLLEEDPAWEAVAAMAYVAAELGAAGDPDEFVSTALWQAEEVAPVRIGMLRRRGGNSWQEEAAAAHARWPENGPLARVAGEALLEAAIAARAAGSAAAADGDDANAAEAGAWNERLETAAVLLQRHWDEVRVYEMAADKNWLGVGLNLISAYRLLRDGPAAERVTSQALTLAPDDDDTLIAAAHVDLMHDRDDAAIARVATVADSAARTLVLLLAYASKQDWPAILALATPERGEAIPGYDRQLFDTTLLRARAETGATDDLVSDIEALLTRWPDSMGILVAATEIARRHAPDLAAALSDRMLAALGPDTHQVERWMMAELALHDDDYETIIRALDGYLAPDHDSPPLRWLALAFANSATRPRTHSFFAGLGPALLADPYYARLAGAAEAARGDLASAEAHLRQALAGDASDVRALIILHSVLMRGDRETDAAAVVAEFDDAAASGAPLDRMRLALLLRRHGEDARALALGFAVASSNRGNREIVELYPALIFYRDDLPAEVAVGGVVAPGCWIDLAGEGVADVAGLIEEGQVPEVSSYAPDHPLARAVLGKAVGDEVTLPQTFGTERRYRIREVKHRAIWLLHDITRHHGTRFPESTTMGEMTLKGDDITPVLDVARQSSAQGDAILAAYAKLAIPLEVLAALHHRPVIAIAELIRHLGGEIRTCLGSGEERDEAIADATVFAGRGAALDLFTAWCAHHLGLLPALAAHFDHLAIPQSALDELLEMRERERPNLGREYMTLGFEGDQAVRTIHPPEETTRRIALFDAAIAALRTYCRILPVDGSDDHELNSLVNRDTIRAMLDPVLLARQHDLYLLSDDLHLRQLGRRYGSGRGGWLQAVTGLLADEGDLTSAELARSVGHLAALKHGHVALDGGTLIAIATLGEPEASALFDAASDYIGGPKAEMVSHLAAVAEFAALVWATDLPGWRKGACFAMLLRKALRGRWDQWADILGILISMLKAMPWAPDRRPDLARVFLSQWIEGHFLHIAMAQSDTGRAATSKRRTKKAGRN